MLLEEVESLMTTQYVCQVAGDRVTLAFFIEYHRRAARFVWPPISLLHRRVAVVTMRRVVADVAARAHEPAERTDAAG
ncbi:hypothetical protein GOARA_035_00160 [Gordonia araii NBRC 100433]|uniref:DUF2867 domain-containing protein n=2 Tax=Gordonia araii TaxID=263909 RepID=G7H085_9ACTN|nr:hypothetical protein GOARA_035_00160 [Gordonia araii NBRC 100433]